MKCSVHIEWIVLLTFFILSISLILLSLQRTLPLKKDAGEIFDEVLREIESECESVSNLSYRNSTLFVKVVEAEKLEQVTCDSCEISAAGFRTGKTAPSGVSIYVRKFPVLLLYPNGTISVEEMVVKVW